ncbi:MAG: VWA domain-containing protein [Bacillota bacterium]|nr:VWA domain-containing protein [Bacillota bacterium]
MDFKIENFYNPHLSMDASRIDVIISVTGLNDGTVIENKNKAFFILLDVSGSMLINEKMAKAKIAVHKCIDLLEPNTLFSIITFQSSVKIVFPLCSVNESSKQRAHETVKKLTANGGTEMSKALLAVLEQIRGKKGLVTYAQLVTDGENNSNDYDYLEHALSMCQGKFQCDCWGIGTSWHPDELKKIANRLLGTADAVPDAGNLSVHFKNSLTNAMSKNIADIKLRIQTPKSVKILSVKQMSPEIVDLSKLFKRIDDRNIDIPLGAWTSESRDYFIAFELHGQNEGDEIMAGRPKIIYSESGQEIVINGDRIIAVWSTDISLTSRINEQVAHYTDQEELADSIKKGLESKARGDIDTATILLKKAAKIAIESNNEEVTTRLKKVIDIVDKDQFTIKLKYESGKSEDLELDMGATRTIRKKPK